MRKPYSRHHISNKPFAIVLVTLVVLLFTASFSSKSQTSDYADDLRYHLPTDLFFTLAVTANNIEHNIPVIKYTARQPIVKGVTIIISDLRPDGNIDASLHALAKTLPDWGWNTLLVMPRLSYVSPVKNGNSGNKEATETPTIAGTSNIDNNNTSDTSKDQTTKADMLNRNSQNSALEELIKPNVLQAPELPYTQDNYVEFISNLTNELKVIFQQGAGYQLIYAEGQSASAMIDMMLHQNNSIAHALVVNNPYWPTMEINTLLPKQLAKIPIPVLDLISLSDNFWAKDTINSRRVEATVELKSLYRQREVFGHHLLQDHNDPLSKELISWTYF